MCTGAHVGLESDFLEVRENMSSLNICAVLKDLIKRNITIYLMISEGTAVGKKFDHNTVCVCVCACACMHACVCVCVYVCVCV